jgi:hypothetical protein
MLARLEAFRLMQPRWLPYPLYLRVAERRAYRALAATVAAHAPHAAERLAGLAEGARTRLESLYLLNGLEAFMCSLAGQTRADVPPSAAVATACSAVAVRGARSASGEPIIARNFDYLPLVQPFYILRECRPASGFRALEFTAAPLAGAIDGMNERGLAITYNYAYAVDHGPPAPTISMAISAALASCATVVAAAEMLLAAPRSGAGLVMLADAEGDIASLELSTTAGELRRPDGDDDAICHSNSYATGSMQAVEAPANAYYSRHVPVALRGRRVLESSDRRDERLAALLAGNKRLDADGLARLLADHGPTGEASEATLCMHSDYWTTTACLQWFPRSRRVRVAYDTACRAQYAEFGL